MLKKLFYKYKSIIMYLIFGVLTTLVNIISYYFLAHPLALSVVISSIIAWVFAVTFAYITNRKYVFESENTVSKDIVKEIISFYLCRLSTGVVDWIIMYVMVDVLSFNDMIIKVMANIIVIVLNYIFSKLIIFKKKKIK